MNDRRKKAQSNPTAQYTLVNINGKNSNALMVDEDVFEEATACLGHVTFIPIGQSIVSFGSDD